MSPIAITLTLLVCVIILFVTEKLPLAVTSMLALMVLVLTGVSSRENIKRFSYQPHYILNGIGDLVPKK